MQTAETGSDPHATSAPGPSPGARIRLLRSRSRSGRGDRTGFPFALAICLLLVVATVSWRQKVFFDGGLDPVVVGKALLTCLALLLCLHLGAVMALFATLPGAAVLVVAWLRRSPVNPTGSVAGQQDPAVSEQLVSRRSEAVPGGVAHA